MRGQCILQGPPAPSIHCPAVYEEKICALAGSFNKHPHKSSAWCIISGKHLSMLYWTETLAIIAGYLSGSVSFAILVTKMLHLPDPFSVYSGNPGATNVARGGHWFAGLMTLSGDMLKAIVPIVIAMRFGLELPLLALTGLAAFFGHLFPVYHRFRGGKGVATMMGCLIALQPQAALVCGAAWLGTVVLTRYISLGSMVAGAVAPVAVWWSSESLFLSVIVTLMAIMVIVRHRSNISLLLAGEENKAGTK